MTLLDLATRISDPDVAARVDRLDLGFDAHGVDPYGVSKQHLTLFYSLLAAFYRHYFTVKVHDIQQIPARGRAMLVGNHSGGVAFDGGILAAATLLELEPPRIVHAMAEKFLNTLPYASIWMNRVGHFTGLPEHAIRLLQDDRLLMVFPEGARGTAKLYRERHSLVRFGTGFVRLALQTHSPIIPVAILGGGEAVPTVANLYALGKVLGVPYLPVTPWLLPLPLPARFDLFFGEPIWLEGSGTEEDEAIEGMVEQVKGKIAELIDAGRAQR